MAARHCWQCSKTLPRHLRADALYCPGSKCRVYAHRSRKVSGEDIPRRIVVDLPSVSVNERQPITPQVLAQLQGKRKQAGLPKLIQDARLQAKAEEHAYKILRERLSDLREAARDRAWAAEWVVLSDQEEQELGRFDQIEIPETATRIGLFVIPPDLGGGSVVLTGCHLHDNR